MMKIVVLDGRTVNPGNLDWTPVSQHGEFTVYERSAREEVLERVGDAEIVLTNKTVLDKELIDAMPNLKYIGVTATGYNVVDLAAARARNVPVTNIPEYGTFAVAQYTMALILELASRVGLHDAAVKNGEWINSRDFCFWKAPMVELEGRTLGLIGYGRIGKAVEKLAKAFGMNVIAYNRSQCEEGKAIGSYVNFDDLLATADVVSLHCPLTAENTGMIGAENIAKMKDGAILLNTARGPLVDEAALAAALRSGKLRGAACDVISAEPMKADNPLKSAPNCIVTPHMAWAPIESRKRIQDCTERSIQAFLDGHPINTVNL